MPTTLPIDLTALVAIMMGSLMFLIPIAGLTARYALKPIVESMARLRDSSSRDEAVALIERRLALIEQEVQSVSNIKEEMSRLVDELEFQRKLTAPRDRTTTE